MNVLKNRLLIIGILCSFQLSVFSPLRAQNADIDVLQSIHVGRNERLDAPLKFVTHTVTPAAFAVPLTVFTVSLIRKDSSLVYKSIYMAESLIVASFISTAMKHAIHRKRPFETYAFIDPQVSAEAGRSFPSGHTSSAFAAATSLSISFPKWYVIAPAFLWAGTVGYSRLHLGVHYPSDVLAGAVVGSGTALLAHVINKKLFERKRKTPEALYIDLW